MPCYTYNFTLDLSANPTSSQGELVVRDGVYVSEDDAAMRLTGVYVPATGRLLAVAEPAAPVLAVPLDAGEGAESLDYRWSPLDEVSLGF